MAQPVVYRFVRLDRHTLRRSDLHPMALPLLLLPLPLEAVDVTIDRSKRSALASIVVNMLLASEDRP